MCDLNAYVPGCQCYRSQQEFDEETARCDADAAIERVLARLLRGEFVAEPDPLALMLYDLVRGEDVADFIVCARRSIAWWDSTGGQHYRSLNTIHARMRIAA
ncbi:hypothetical protein [Paraburkholderia sp. BR10882]|uniref:hypothetical protein n=1 Tax=unclassified Paraburkholderia TaxID=2615204 RepID=UPI0034D01913